MHNRLEYLRHLIVSLAQARDIDSVLLIFSHDYFDEDINQLITTIDFCKVRGIFIARNIFIMVSPSVSASLRAASNAHNFKE